MYDFSEDARMLWDYHHLNQPIEKRECLIGFGSHDTHVAERTAELFNQGFGSLIIFTGGLGRITKSIWHKTEAEKFADIAYDMGVSPEKVLIETDSTNTGENIANTKRLIAEEQVPYRKFIVVDKPFKERRLYATLKKQWPELDFIVTSPQFSYEEYCNYYRNSPELEIEDFINIMVGDLQRIDIYGKNGFQIPQSIPEDVKAAFNHLVKNGFNKQLIRE